MLTAIVLVLAAYLAVLALGGLIAYRVLTYVLDHDHRAAVRRAAYDAWVMAQPAAYHEQRMNETYR